MQTTVRHEAELEGDSLRHIQPVQFVMKDALIPDRLQLVLRLRPDKPSTFCLL